MPALSWLMNLGFAGTQGDAPPAPVVTDEPVDKGRDAGSGRKPLTYVDPYELYGTPKKRLKVKEARARLREVRKALPAEAPVDLAPLTAQVTTLVNRVSAFEKRVEQAATEAAAARLADEYRQMVAVRDEIERELKAAEHRARLYRDDEEFLSLIARML